MNKLLLNSTSKKVLDAIINDLPQSLLLTGELGVGLSTIAKHIAERKGIIIQIILPEKDEKIDLETGVIGIEIMRRLYEETKTKSSGRLIAIDYVERMTTQAQNAFLKLLEEPNPGTYFILLSHSASKLLPTITSRTEKVHFLPINLQQSIELLDELGVSDSVKRSQLLFIAVGLPAELTRLATDESYFSERSEIVRDAKLLLGTSIYQKLLIAQKYKDKRVNALTLLADAAKMLKKNTNTNPNAHSIKQIDTILSIYEQIEHNGNIRLNLTSMVI